MLPINLLLLAQHLGYRSSVEIILASTVTKTLANFEDLISKLCLYSVPECWPQEPITDHPNNDHQQLGYKFGAGAAKLENQSVASSVLRNQQWQ